MSQKVECYACGHLHTKVLPWRSYRSGEHEQAKRRRECLHCGAVFETHEQFTKAISQPKKPAA